MLATRQNKNIEFEGTKLILFQDLSKHTLALSRALKPLLEPLQERDSQYRWRFPFHLQAHYKGLTATFRDLEHLPEFLKIPQLPEVKLPHWPRMNFETSTKPWRKDQGLFQ